MEKQGTIHRNQWLKGIFLVFLSRVRRYLFLSVRPIPSLHMEEDRDHAK